MNERGVDQGGQLRSKIFFECFDRNTMNRDAITKQSAHTFQMGNFILSERREHLSLLASRESSR